MENKITEMVATVKAGKEKRNILVEKKKELEEILLKTLKKKKDVLIKRHLQLNKKQILENAMAVTKEAPVITQRSTQKPDDMDSPDISLEAIEQLTNDLHDYSQFMQDASEIVDQKRNSISEKTAKVNELQAECEHIENLIRNKLPKLQKKQQDLNAKLIALKLKKKALDEKTSSLSMDVQQQQIRFTTLSKDIENLDGKFDEFMAQFKRQGK